MHASLCTRSTVAVLVSSFVVLAGCGGDDGSGEGKPYPRSAERAFMDSCEAGAETSYCACALEEVQDVMSYEEFKREDTAVLAGRTLSRKVTDAFAECR